MGASQRPNSANALEKVLKVDTNPSRRLNAESAGRSTQSKPWRRNNRVLRRFQNPSPALRRKPDLKVLKYETQSSDKGISGLVLESVKQSDPDRDLGSSEGSRSISEGEICSATQTGTPNDMEIPKASDPSHTSISKGRIPVTTAIPANSRTGHHGDLDLQDYQLMLMLREMQNKKNNMQVKYSQKPLPLTGPDAFIYHEFPTTDAATTSLRYRPPQPKSYILTTPSTPASFLEDPAEATHDEEPEDAKRMKPEDEQDRAPREIDDSSTTNFAVVQDNPQVYWNHRKDSKRQTWAQERARLFMKNTISEDHSEGLEADRLGKLRLLNARTKLQFPTKS